MSRRGWFLLVAVGVIWGIPYLLIKIAVADVTPAMVVFVRTALGALLLLPFALRGGGLRVLRGRWPAVLGFALLEIVLPWILLSNAERTLSSSTTGLLVATVPIAAVVLGRLVGDRRPVAAVRWLGLLVGLGGVALLLGPGAAGGDPWAVTQVLLAALGYASAPIIADRALRDVPAIPLTATCLGLTALVYLPVVLVTGPHPWPPPDAVLALVGARRPVHRARVRALLPADRRGRRRPVDPGRVPQPGRRGRARRPGARRGDHGHRARRDRTDRARLRGGLPPGTRT